MAEDKNSNTTMIQQEDSTSQFQQQTKFFDHESTNQSSIFAQGFMTSNMTLRDGPGKFHEIDSIVDYRDVSYRRNTVQGADTAQFQLEMSCECCEGRQVWFLAKRIFEDGCPALQDLAHQTIQLNQGGFNIVSNKTQQQQQQATPCVENGQVDDDFWMNDEDEEEIIEKKQSEQKTQFTQMIESTAILSCGQEGGKFCYDANNFKQERLHQQQQQAFQQEISGGHKKQQQQLGVKRTWEECNSEEDSSNEDYNTSAEEDAPQNDQEGPKENFNHEFDCFESQSPDVPQHRQHKRFRNTQGKQQNSIRPFMKIEAKDIQFANHHGQAVEESKDSLDMDMNTA